MVFMSRGMDMRVWVMVLDGACVSCVWISVRVIMLVSDSHLISSSHFPPHQIIVDKFVCSFGYQPCRVDCVIYQSVKLIILSIWCRMCAGGW